jgi:hypothetical protein
MDILKMLAEFRTERQRVEEAIVALERLAGSIRGKRRGRPPKWASAAGSALAPVRKKRTVSAAARKRMAAAQKKRWALRKAQAKAAAS